MKLSLRSDISKMDAALGGSKIKEVDLEQEAKSVRQRTYRYIVTVGVVAMMLLSLALGCILFYKCYPDGIWMENSGEDIASPILGPEEALVHQYTVSAIADSIDGKLSPLSTTTVMAMMAEEESIYEESGDDFYGDTFQYPNEDSLMGKRDDMFELWFSMKD